MELGLVCGSHLPFRVWVIRCMPGQPRTCLELDPCYPTIMVEKGPDWFFVVGHALGARTKCLAAKGTGCELRGSREGNMERLEPHHLDSTFLREQIYL